MEFSSKKIEDFSAIAGDCLVLPVLEGKKPFPAATEAVNKASGGLLKKLLDEGSIKRKNGQSTLLYSVSGLKSRRLLLVACAESLSSSEFSSLITGINKIASEEKVSHLLLGLDGVKVKDRDESWLLCQTALLLESLNYQYKDTQSKAAKKKPLPSLKKVTLASFASMTAKAQNKVLHTGSLIASGMNSAKQLGNLPANLCTPSDLASEARTLARKHTAIHTSILDEKQMEKLGMNALLSVGRASSQPSRLIVINYQGAAKTERPQVLVGKGITFDTGGISLKPGAKMDEMKYDMCGAASVIGTLSAVAQLGLRLNVIGIIASAENMPAGNASKPGDVVRSMSGQSIEILNTDAEGRLVLCDALTYAERFKPAAVIDIATLTGACVVALGKHASALYSNNDKLKDAIIAAGEHINDRVWPMPLWDDYQRQLDSNFADMANIGGPEGGSITAACFLSRFADKYHWAHLDIAGTAWLGGTQKGATGRPVALLTQYLLDQC